MVIDVVDWINKSRKNGMKAKSTKINGLYFSRTSIDNLHDKFHFKQNCDKKKGSESFQINDFLSSFALFIRKI